MDYLPNIAAQTRQFLLCLGFGFALGILYDLFRIIRLLTNKTGTAALLIQDILYCLLCTGFTFFFLLSACDGALRAYAVLGEILGWLIYYVSFGTVALKSSEWLVRALRRAARTLARWIAAPFLRLLHLAEKIAAALRRWLIWLKVTKKNFIFGLHFTPKVLYNENQSNTEHKEKARFAKQIRTPRERGRRPGGKRHLSAAARGSAAALASNKEEPRDQPDGARGGSSVRAVRGVPRAAKPRANGKGARAKRGHHRADPGARRADKGIPRGAGR